MRVSPIYALIVKFIVIALAVAELWLVLGIPSVSNALIALFTIGAIPGTDKTLTPNQTYQLLVAVFFIITSVVFRNELTGLFPRRRNRSRSLLEPVTLVSTPIMPPTVKLHREHRIHLDQKVVFAVRRLLRRAWHRISHYAQVGAFAAMAIAVRGAILLVRLWYWAEPYLWRFDGWLDRTLHHFGPTARVLDLGARMFDTVNSQRKRARHL